MIIFKNKENSNIRFLEHTVVPRNSEVHCGSSIVFGTYIFADLLTLIIGVTCVKCPFFASVFLRINLQLKQ